MPPPILLCLVHKILHGLKAKAGGIVKDGVLARVILGNLSRFCQMRLMPVSRKFLKRLNVNKGKSIDDRMAENIKFLLAWLVCFLPFFKFLVEAPRRLLVYLIHRALMVNPFSSV